MFPKDWTASEGDKPMSDGHRAFWMGNVLVVGVPHIIGLEIAKLYQLSRGHMPEAVRAWKILDDFERSIELLEDATNPADFRVQWVSAMVLCRAVGDALKNDADEDVRHKGGELYKEWRGDEDCVFNTFIKPERDAVAHGGDSGVDVDFLLVPLVFDEQVIVENEGLYVPFAGGKFGGVDTRDKLIEARDWWILQIKRTEAE